MVNIPLVIIAFTAGIFAGYLARVFLAKKIHEMNYAGTMLVVKTPEKTIFSLELEGDPEALETQDEVIFKVSRHPLMTSHDNHGV
jgi:hypothetical protein